MLHNRSRECVWSPCLTTVFSRTLFPSPTPLPQERLDTVQGKKNVAYSPCAVETAFENQSISVQLNEITFPFRSITIHSVPFRLDNHVAVRYTVRQMAAEVAMVDGREDPDSSDG